MRSLIGVCVVTSLCIQREQNFSAKRQTRTRPGADLVARQIVMAQHMSCDGTAIGWPLAGTENVIAGESSARPFNLLRAERNNVPPSESPVKIQHEAVQTSGWKILIALLRIDGSSPECETCSVGARVEQHWMLAKFFFQNVPNDGLPGVRPSRAPA